MDSECSIDNAINPKLTMSTPLQSNQFSSLVTPDVSKSSGMDVLSNSNLTTEINSNNEILSCTSSLQNTSWSSNHITSPGNNSTASSSMGSGGLIINADLAKFIHVQASQVKIHSVCIC